MKRITAFIPNLLTLLNLVSGCIAVVSALKGNFSMAFWMVIVAAVFDFFDGFAARLLHVSSPMGKELDSLADVVSFGVAPSMVLYTMIGGVEGMVGWGGCAVFLLAACSAYRLAKFNLDERQTEEFRGLPTPACALFFISLPFLVERFGMEWVFHPGVLLGLTVLFSVLLVSDIPMFALKFKGFGLNVKGNVLRYGFMLVSLVLLVLFLQAAPALIIGCYILISVIRALGAKKNG